MMETYTAFDLSCTIQTHIRTIYNFTLIYTLINYVSVNI